MYVKGNVYKVNNPLHFCINKGDIFTLVDIIDDTYKLYDGYQTLYLSINDMNEVFKNENI